MDGAQPDIASALGARTDGARLVLRRDVELAKAEIRGAARHAGGAGAGLGRSRRCRNQTIETTEEDISWLRAQMS